jgi:hypothetical protein
MQSTANGPQSTVKGKRRGGVNGAFWGLAMGIWGRD